MTKWDLLPEYNKVQQIKINQCNTLYQQYERKNKNTWQSQLMQKEKKYLTKLTKSIKTLNIIKSNVKKHTSIYSMVKNWKHLIKDQE